jgi:hypothetical protein
MLSDLKSKCILPCSFPSNNTFIAKGVSPSVLARTSIGEVNCSWRFLIEMGLPSRVGGNAVAIKARKLTYVMRKRTMNTVPPRNIIGGRGIRDRMRFETANS